uniref:Fucosyltransferase n=1 Tax=Leersia perrieri TaxID=77586 RepID=A0A0D9VLE9_9ORYZ
MDVKRTRSPRAPGIDADEDKKRAAEWRGAVRPHMVLVGFLITLPILVFVFGGRWGSFTSYSSSSPSTSVPNVGGRHVVAGGGVATTQKTEAPRNVSAPPTRAATTTPPPQDKLLGGLLSAAFEESSCQSRYKSSLYRKKSPFPLSPYLVQKLRKYEAYHKKCGPGTKRYRNAIKQLKAGRNVDNAECKYVVWFPCNGLGNRMLTIASTFLYALLSDRVLLMHVAAEQQGLFCEPFPGSSWVLPGDFPHNNPQNLHIGAPESYVNMLKNNVVRNDDPSSVQASSLPPYVYLHVEQFRLKLSDNIFCDEDQMVLKKFNWMILKSDSYFAPALFMTPMYEKELEKMFPQKESVFHHLGRYLFHPTNKVWGIVSRYYEAYLARVDEKIGFQIRIFPEKPIKFENMYDQLMRCIREQRLLPELGTAEPAPNTTAAADAGKVKAVLIASLYSGYYEKIRGMYYENPTKTGEIVAVYQPSHEEQQQYTSNEHNQKALAEIYLLSYCDKIAMSAWSTFGYVAYSFAGVKPWILLRPDWNQERSEVACVRSTSVEPCLHSPPILSCRAKKEVDVATVKPYVRHCEDVGFGLKLSKAPLASVSGEGRIAETMDVAKMASRTPRAVAFNAVNGGEFAGVAGGGSEKVKRWGWRPPSEVAVAVGFIATLTLLVLMSGGTGNLPSSFSFHMTGLVLKPAGAQALPTHEAQQDVPASSPRHNHDHDYDRLLGGLLSPAFDEHSCRSRYASSLYRRRSPFRPSTYLVQRLRRYESRHKRCGPGSALFDEAVEHLRSGRNAAARSECQYVVWTPFNGLGNRMLALASTFLYALLTDRVLLVHAPPEFDGLFCEPFPGSSWALPHDFPITDFDGVFTMWSPTSYKNMRQTGRISNDTAEDSLPAYVFLDLIQSFTDAAFCEEDQRVLAKFNWMVVKSDVYFAAMFFLMPAYERELARLFPEKESVFHHLARYLFHPSNDVWGIVHRFYEAYLASADERVGLQVRVFPEMPIPFDNMYDQIIRCSDQEGLLPRLGQTNGSSVGGTWKLTSILVTSLFSDYYDRIHGVYQSNPTVTGEYVAVHQPSHEREQHTEARGHNQRALAEIYLLSFCDRVVTTAVSTFGYVAHGLAGSRPWVLLRPPSPVARAEPACVRSETVEPCLQAAPRRMCGAAKGSDIGALVPHIRHCEDVPRGVKVRRASVRAALVLCFLTLFSTVLLLQRWQPTSSWTDWLFEAEHQAEAGEQDIQDDLLDDLTPSQYIGYDKFLGGLLLEGFDEVSCRSRYQFARYHKNSTRVPSSYLLQRLRRQEALQKKCGPGTKSYKQAVKLLRSRQGINMTSDCNYLFLTIHAGLGNRMLEIASAFLYALLTNRILLLDRYQEIGDLFCEPFPGTSWLMPSDFPLNYGEFTQSTPESYGNMLQNKVVGGNTDRSLAGSRPPYVFLYLDGNYEFHDKLFFCEDDQQFLQGVPWLIMRTDMYFIPSLFLIPSYQDELSRLFPEKDAVFHHLARYLFHPTNEVWYTVTKYYRSYLAKADKTVGIQIRIFEKEGILQRNGRFPHFLEQILSCAQNEKLLPEISMTDETPTTVKNNHTIAVLTTSLSSWYSDEIQKKYSEHRTVDGTTVKVYQPSHEEYQRSKNKKHNMKALAEIYLLSMTDVLITSGFSTFGYAAQGLSGLTPWILFRSDNHVVPHPPCRRAMSIEPCFHQAPFYDCKAKKDADLGKMVPYVRHCEDVSWGLKVVNQTQR